MNNTDIDLSNVKYFEILEQAVESGSVDSGSLCLVGSSALALRQIRLNNDLDIIIQQGEDISSLNADEIEVANHKYGDLGISDEEIINNNKYHDEINGWKIIRPEIEYSYKQFRGKKKDLADIELLKEYRQKREDWNEELVIYQSPTSIIDIITHSRRLGISVVPHLIRRYAQDSNSSLDRFLWGRRSIVARSFQSMKRDGLLTTLSRGTRLIKENDPTGILDTYSNPRYKIKVGNLVSDGIRLEYPLTSILESQLQGGKFRRYDLILCLLAVEQEISVNQLELVSDRQLQSSLKKIQEYNQGQSPRKISVRINENGDIIDPEMLAFGISQHKDSFFVELCEEEVTNSYDMTWLRGTDLSKEVIQTIQTRYEELLDEAGILYKFFVWPTGKQFDQKIQEIITSHGSIIQHQDLSLDRDGFENFVMDIYEIEHEFTDRHQHISKLKGKINYSLEHGNDVRIYRVLLSEPKLKEGSSDTMAFAKESIRKHCYPELPLGKAHLNPVIHGTDNHEHNRLVNDIISEYMSKFSSNPS